MRDDDWLKQMLAPTLEQTARFADHVADNHSWYKHLPFFPPGASFVFFPNPHAGWGVRILGDQFIVYEIEHGDYFAHHSRLSTAEYRDRFGHWDYWVDDNPRQREPVPGPWIYWADGNHRELLADDLKRQWSCRLTAFLKPAPPMLSLRPSEFKREADAFLASGRRRFGRVPMVFFSMLGRARTEDPVVERYRAAAGELRQAAGLRNHLAAVGFMESEAIEQRRLLLATLHRVRAAWSMIQGGP